MRKIPTLFMRDGDGNRQLVTSEPNPEAAWVFAGEGIASRKRDGASCLIRDGKLYKRYELKSGEASPEGFEPVQEVDVETGIQPGWVPVGAGPEDAVHNEGFTALVLSRPMRAPSDGTYELIGPKVNNNAERFHDHYLWKHGIPMFPTPPRDFDGLQAFLREYKIEGIVWHHPDGRMAKLKRTDLGFLWPITENK